MTVTSIPICLASYPLEIHFTRSNRRVLVPLHFQSFEKHLEGRPHKTMVEELDRSYKLKVALLRHEARVMEQQRENDMKRAHRKSNKAKMQQRGSCTMCDLTFYGTLPAHRKNERHQVN